MVFHIESFEVVLTINDSIHDIKTEGRGLSQEQLNYIKRLKDNYPIIFNNIMILKQNGKLKKMEPIVYFFDKSSE
jgi:hypothetical protein